MQCLTLRAAVSGALSFTRRPTANISRREFKIDMKGFRDELSFFDRENDEAVAMSFWETEKDAAMYERDIYPQVSKKMADALETSPIVRQFEIANSTWYDIHPA